MLKAAFEEIEKTTEKNMRAGFEACGIVPLNRNKVLQKIPDNDSIEDDSSSPWLKAFV
jgi:hypothetical protein